MRTPIALSMVGVRSGERDARELGRDPGPIRVLQQPDRFLRGASHQIQQRVLVDDLAMQGFHQIRHLLRVCGRCPQQCRGDACCRRVAVRDRVWCGVSHHGPCPTRAALYVHAIPVGAAHPPEWCHLRTGSVTSSLVRA